MQSKMINDIFIAHPGENLVFKGADGIDSFIVKPNGEVNITPKELVSPVNTKTNQSVFSVTSNTPKTNFPVGVNGGILEVFVPESTKAIQRYTDYDCSVYLRSTQNNGITWTNWVQI